MLWRLRRRVSAADGFLLCLNLALYLLRAFAVPFDGLQLDSPVGCGGSRKSRARFFFDYREANSSRRSGEALGAVTGDQAGADGVAVNSGEGARHSDQVDEREGAADGERGGGNGGGVAGVVDERLSG